VNTASPATPTGPQSVFGLWVRDSFTGVPVGPDVLDKVTEVGRNANASYDPLRDDPTINCRPANPVRAWAAPGQPTEIREESGRVVIQHEFMDTTRIVHLNSQDRPADVVRSEMGYSTGHMEDGALIVETAYFDAGVLLTHVRDSGLMHGSALQLREEFSVVAETGQLRYQWEARDPEYWLEPISSQLLLSPTRLQIGTFDCHVMEFD
jgi:hypothetical protein